MDNLMHRLANQPSDEDWFDPDFVERWLARQHERRGERARQFAMVRSLVPRAADEYFRYIDLGAGDGALDEVLLTRFVNAEATLLDGSPTMIERARARLRPFGQRATVVQGDLTTPAWLETVRGPYDVAVSSISLHNLEDPRLVRELYREIWSVLADGGLFMNLEYLRAPSRALWSYYVQASADPDGWSMPIRGLRDYVGTLDEQLAWLREAGFGPVDCFWKEFRLGIFGGFKGHVHESRS
ncbi:MAG: methyltransferase domain-containing protein [Chloroflexi bacterium]|nr:methyltransferase domain-containing protein [Chloroflexota bacterium]